MGQPRVAAQQEWQVLGLRGPPGPTNHAHSWEQGWLLARLCWMALLCVCSVR